MCADYMSRHPVKNSPKHSYAEEYVGFVATIFKGALSWYGKLTWESAHAWNLIILCFLIDLGMTFIFIVHLSFYTIPMLIYDVIYDITTIPQGTQL